MKLSEIKTIAAVLVDDHNAHPREMLLAEQTLKLIELVKEVSDRLKPDGSLYYLNDSAEEVGIEID